MKKLVIIFGLLVSIMANAEAQAANDSLQQLMSIIAEQQAAIDKLESSRPYLKWQDYLGVGVLVLAIVSLIGYYFKLTIEAAKNASLSRLQARIDEFERSAQSNISSTEEKIITAINGNEALFNKLRNAVDLEELLIKSKTIKIVGETPDNILTLLTQIRFPRKNLFTIADKQPEHFDIYFINNEGGSLNLDEMVELVKELPDQVHVFYYCSKHGVFFPTGKLPYEMRDRVNFATNSAQIYGNFMNSLKYQHRLSKL